MLRVPHRLHQSVLDPRCPIARQPLSWRDPRRAHALRSSAETAGESTLAAQARSYRRELKFCITTHPVRTPVRVSVAAIKTR